MWKPNGAVLLEEPKTDWKPEGAIPLQEETSPKKVEPETPQLTAAPEPGIIGKALSSIKEAIREKTGYFEPPIYGRQYRQEHPVKTLTGMGARIGAEAVAGRGLYIPDIISGKLAEGKTLAEVVDELTGFTPSPREVEASKIAGFAGGLKTAGGLVSRGLAKVPAGAILKTILGSGLTFGTRKAAEELSLKITKDKPIDWQGIHFEAATGELFGAGEIGLQKLFGFMRGVQSFDQQVSATEHAAEARVAARTEINKASKNRVKNPVEWQRVRAKYMGLDPQAVAKPAKEAVIKDFGKFPLAQPAEISRPPPIALEKPPAVSPISETPLTRPVVPTKPLISPPAEPTLEIKPKTAIVQPEAKTPTEQAVTAPKIKPVAKDYVKGWLSDYKTGEPGISQDVSRPDGSGVLVYRDQKGNPIGVVAFDPTSITDIAVNPKNRRQGIATQLIKAVNEKGITNFKGPFSKEAVELIKNITLTSPSPEQPAAKQVQSELLAKARELDRQKGYTIIDVTPEGYGPEEATTESISTERSQYTTEQQKLMSSIAEAKTLLKGKVSGEKRAAIERSLKSAEKKLAELPELKPPAKAVKQTTEQPRNMAEAKDQSATQWMQGLAKDIKAGQEIYIPPQVNRIFTFRGKEKSALIPTSTYLRQAGFVPAERANYWKKQQTPPDIEGQGKLPGGRYSGAIINPVTEIQDLAKKTARVLSEKIETSEEKEARKKGTEIMAKHYFGGREADILARQYKIFGEHNIPKDIQVKFGDAVEMGKGSTAYDKLSPPFQKLADYARALVKPINKKGVEVGFAEPIKFEGNQIHVQHWWKGRVTGEAYAANYGKFSKGTPQSKQRYHPDLAEGRASGLKQATDNIFEMIGEQLKSTVYAAESRNMVKSLGMENLVLPKPEEGYSRITDPILRKKIAFKGKDGKLVILEKDAYIHDALKQYWHNYTTNPTYGTASKVISVARDLKLSLSFFHPAALMRNFFETWTNPKGIIQGWQAKGAPERTPTTRLLYTVGLNTHSLDPTGYHVPATNWLGKTWNVVSLKSAIFRHIQPTLKWGFAIRNFENNFRAKFGDLEMTDKNFHNPEVIKMARQVVKAADNFFSSGDVKANGLEAAPWMAKIYYSPTARKVWSNLLISPEWQRAHLSAAKEIGKSLIGKGDQYTSGTYLKYLSSILGMYVLADYLNYMWTKEMDGKGVHVWNNKDPFSVRLPMNRADGKPVYVRPYKSETEVAEMVVSAIRGDTGKFTSKVNPLPSAILKQLYPSYPEQYEKGGWPARGKALLSDLGAPISVGKTAKYLAQKNLPEVFGQPKNDYQFFLDFVLPFAGAPTSSPRDKYRQFEFLTGKPIMTNKELQEEIDKNTYKKSTTVKGVMHIQGRPKKGREEKVKELRQEKEKRMLNKTGGFK